MELHVLKKQVKVLERLLIGKELLLLLQRTEVGSQLPYGGSQPPRSPVPGGPIFSLASRGPKHACSVHTYILAKHLPVSNLFDYKLATGSLKSSDVPWVHLGEGCLTGCFCQIY